MTKLKFVTKNLKSYTFCDEKWGIGDGKFSSLKTRLYTSLLFFILSILSFTTVVMNQKPPNAEPIRNAIRDDPIRRTHSQWSRRFQRFPLVTISTIRFPLEMISPILIPIGDDPQRFWFPFATPILIHDDCRRFQFGPFTTIPGGSNHSRGSRSHHRRFGPFAMIPKLSPPSNDLPPPTDRRFASFASASLCCCLCSKSVRFFFFFFLFTFPSLPFSLLCLFV